ncbi:unnamed protein product [Brassicogethes aeneus]|uniref:Transmembrane protein 53 n=1 Tax=Brassicogethes aeneus TaxID=1431903 RepID=A0A9P0FNI7_BRAAE|nr:unnamed protein product [Brassicogethes aeneus]
MALSSMRSLSTKGIDVFKHQNHNKQIILFSLRNLSVLPINKNLSIISEEKKNTRVSNLTLERPDDKPLVVLLSWLMAKKKNIFKYADIYAKEGYDVLNVSVSPWQLLWPTKGTQVVAAEILSFLERNASYSPIVLHGFSVGAYLWSEALVQMAAQKERYQPVLDRIQGQVWDSATDITEITIGLPIAVFPRNRVLQTALKKYIIYHMNAFDKISTCHYVRASQMFHTNLVKAPALFFLSKSDQIGAFSANSRAKESWEGSGIKVRWNCWEKSPHVGHLRAHKEEYTNELSNFLKEIKENLKQEQKQEKIQLVN